MNSVKDNLTKVLSRIDAVKNQRESGQTCGNIQLVAVSKKKSIDDIIEAYNAGQRHFGENYVQELEEKANSEKIHQNCPEILWHFIGHLQTNKAKKIAALPNLHIIETVDSVKLAEILNNYTKTKNSQLNIMIQVNTSLEPQKSGVLPIDLSDVYSKIKQDCSNLIIKGIMTIGSYEASTNPDEINKDFKTLIECKHELANKLNLNQEAIETSMGMSHDFEQAIKMGSNNVRVGSLIFGQR